MPDFIEVDKFMGQQNVAKKQPYDRTTIWLLFIAGGFLLFIGIFWMKAV